MVLNLEEVQIEEGPSLLRGNLSSSSDIFAYARKNLVHFYPSRPPLEVDSEITGLRFGFSGDEGCLLVVLTYTQILFYQIKPETPQRVYVKDFRSPTKPSRYPTSVCPVEGGLLNFREFLVGFSDGSFLKVGQPSIRSFRFREVAWEAWDKAPILDVVQHGNRVVWVTPQSCGWPEYRTIQYGPSSCHYLPEEPRNSERQAHRGPIFGVQSRGDHLFVGRLTGLLDIYESSGEGWVLRVAVQESQNLRGLAVSSCMHVCAIGYGDQLNVYQLQADDTVVLVSSFLIEARQYTGIAWQPSTGCLLIAYGSCEALLLKDSPV